MKKILSLLVLAMMAGSALAGDKPVITVADVEALPGQTVSFAVNLTDGKADTYTAMTLYAYFPTTGFTTTGDYTVLSAWKGTSCTVGDVDPGTGLATIPFASSNAIPGSAVDNLVTVEFTVDASTPTGVYDVTLKGTMFEYNSSDKDYADDVTFKVTVTDRITLDETATVAPAAAGGVNVTVKRTINANEWSTICLPFAMTEAQVKAAFGDDVKLADFDSYDTTEDTDENVIAISMKFVSVTEIEANHPYLIKTSSLVSQFNVDGVDINSDEENAVVEYDNGKTGKKREVYGSFIGTLHSGVTIHEKDIFLSGNKFYYATNSTQKMKAFRGYFELVDDLVGYAPGIDIIIDGNTTGINEVHGLFENGAFYDLNGMKVENPTKKGVYIQNGKKVVVK